MKNQIVIRYLDGQTEKGYSSDFQPHKEIFHLVVKTNGQEKSLPVKMNALKAIFFVKELKNEYRVRTSAQPTFEDFCDKKMIGKKVKVEFNDGEVAYGLTLGYSPQRRGFFFSPIDPDSNNERIFAVMNSVKNINKSKD